MTRRRSAHETRDSNARRALTRGAREHHVRGEAGRGSLGAPVPRPGRDGERVSESPTRNAPAPRVVRLSRRARRLAQTRLQGSPRDADGYHVRGVERRLRLGRLERYPEVHEAGVFSRGVGVLGRRRVAVVFGFGFDCGTRREVGARELEPRGRVRRLARVHAPAALCERHRGG